MKIKFNTDTLEPMIGWLREYRNTGRRDPDKLKEILSMPDYQIEFRRYGMEGLPVCGISREEAIDFFMRFDKGEFDNPRLKLKQPSFMRFFEELDERVKGISVFSSVSDDDCAVIEKLLQNGLPDDVQKETEELEIILIVSIGNSMGWPFGNYVDYDVANLDQFETKDDFLHLTAHEIHHLFLGSMLFGEGIRSEDFFLQNFAYEGLAVHFNNNLGTRMKSPKYPGKTYMMQKDDMEFYEQHFDEIFSMIRSDFETSKTLSVEEVMKLVSKHYEQFEFMGKPVRQYPTYYFGCYLWGLVDLAFGKEKLFEAITDPPLFRKLYNSVSEEKYRL